MVYRKLMKCSGRTSSKSAVFLFNSISWNYISGGAAFSFVPSMFETGFKKKIKTILIFLIKNL